MELDKKEMARIIAVFESEASEHIRAITDIVLNLESISSEQLIEQLNEAYRQAHSLKGSAGTLGFESVSTITHQLEDLFSNYRNEKVSSIGSDEVDSMLDIINDIKVALKDCLSGIGESRRDAVIGVRGEEHQFEKKELSSSHAHRDANQLNHAPKDALPLQENALPYLKNLAKTFFALQEQKDIDIHSELEHAVENANRLMELAHDQGDEQTFLICEYFNSALDEIIQNQYRLDSGAADLLLTTLDTIRKAIQSPPTANSIPSIPPVVGQLRKFIENMSSMSRPVTNKVASASPQKPIEAKRSPSKVSKPSQPLAGTEPSNNKFIRVAERTLDSVIAKIDELFEGTLQLEVLSSAITDIEASVVGFIQKVSAMRSTMIIESQVSEAMDSVVQYNNDLALQLRHVADRFDRQGQRFSKIVRVTQQELHKIRLAPMSTLFITIRQQVRELSRTTKKPVELILDGGEHAIDRRVLEAIEAPIIHILRNSIDHGIEGKEQRLKAGKLPVGTIRVEARHIGDSVELLISDDGRGIDPEQVRDTLKKRLNLSDEQVDGLSNDQLFDYLFEPGFSTQSTVSSLSGRGVGMDVVKHTVENLGGEVRFESQKGKGTQLNLRLPLVMSTVRCLVIKVSQRVLSIPASNIEKILMIEAQDSQIVGGVRTISYQGSNILLVHLANVLGLSTVDRDWVSSSKTVTIVRFGERRIAFVIDELIEYTTLIIKPLGDLLERVPCISGLAILNTGELSLVLNPGALMRAAHGASTDVTLESFSKRSSSSDVARVLVVDDSITTRTLEKTLLESAGFSVITATDGPQALRLLNTQHCDLVICDVQMPKMDGFELTRTIKSNTNTSHLPVVLITALGSDQDKMKGMASGADAYIVKKELSRHELISTINQLL